MMIFETTTSSQAPFLPRSLWQYKAHFEAPTPVHEGDTEAKAVSETITPQLQPGEEVSPISLPTHTPSQEPEIKSEQHNLWQNLQREELDPHSNVMQQQEQTTTSHLRYSQ